MKILIRKYEEKDLTEDTNLGWNCWGRKCISSGRTPDTWKRSKLFSEQTYTGVAVDSDMEFISYIQIILADAVTFVMRAMQ